MTSTAAASAAASSSAAAPAAYTDMLWSQVHPILERDMLSMNLKSIKR